MEIAAIALHYGWLLLVPLALAFYKKIGRLFGIVFVPDDSIGVINKKFALGKYSTLPDGKIVALNGEAGLQADTLAPGIHPGYWPWQYKIELQKFITIPEGAMGIVEARDGAPIPNGRVLARKVNCDSF